ncbi:MAG: hypothetical protein AAF960_29330 [Bacteroidota bacterium]
MKYIYCIALIFVLIAHLSCKKENTTPLTEIDLAAYVGDYCVTCSGNQILYHPSDSIDTRIKFDTTFQDILTIWDSLWIDHRGDNILSVNTLIQQYPYFQRASYGGNSYFEVTGNHSDSLLFNFPLDSYACKCGANLSIKGDSIFYFVSNQWTSDSYLFWCDGVKKKY